MANTAPDLATIKSSQQQVWSKGDFSLVAIPLVLMSELLCEIAEIHAGERVLDVATGSGNTAIAAARRNAKVTGVDYVPELIERARERARAERLEIDFQVGDAEDLAFPDASFDVVLSTLGAMFAPDHKKTASELLRVTRPGGRIGLTAWTPEGRLGELFRLIGSFNPPPPNLTPPPRWGTEDYLQELLGHGVDTIRAERRICNLQDTSPKAWLDFFRAHYGPTYHAFNILDADQHQELEDRMIEWATSANIATDGTLVIPCEYLEVVAVRNKNAA